MLTTKSDSGLGDMYRSWLERATANPDIDIRTVRDMYGEWELLGLEAAGVTYEDVDAGGVAGKWANPPSWDGKCIMYLHGGGWSAGSVHTHRKYAGHLAKASDRRVLLVDYGLAPEVAYPRPLDDCETALRWLIREEKTAASAIAIGGDSCGGGMAMSLTNRLRQQGEPLPGALVLVSPFVDLRVTGDSWEENRLNDAGMPSDPDAPHPAHAAVQGYLQGALDPGDPLVNGLTADLSGFPPMYVAVGSYEALLSDSTRVVERAREAGVDAVLEVAEGMQHIYPLMAGCSSSADQTIARIAEWLRSR